MQSNDLGNVTDVTGWFKNHTGIKDLTPLRYTLVDSLKAADMKPLTQLERIAMPMVLVKIEDGTFADAKNLRWADFMLCDNANLMADLQISTGMFRTFGYMAWNSATLQKISKNLSLNGVSMTMGGIILVMVMTMMERPRQM